MKLGALHRQTGHLLLMIVLAEKDDRHLGGSGHANLDADADGGHAHIGDDCTCALD